MHRLHLHQPRSIDEGSSTPIVYQCAWRPENAVSFVTLRDQSGTASVMFEEKERHLYVIYQFVSTSAPIPHIEFTKRAVGTVGSKIEVAYTGFEEAIATYMKVIDAVGAKEEK
ncbi:hypothetical protein C7999DRAFT_28392 [Corynascus novoguineensis]|uniref:Uncharacterized protein n=1 Tax=Corynascus novoguineensis TaxID=1126955 RepID=A0AAN7HTR7_9PEZI|nr:hypothetical protein C7999DRAFT_28392 [Corynascus novoguineensis]